MPTDLTRLKQQHNQPETVEVVSVPVRLALLTMILISFGGLAWACLARIPIYVNGYSYMLNLGSSKVFPTMVEGEINFQFSSTRLLQSVLYRDFYQLSRRSNAISPKQVLELARQVLVAKMGGPEFDAEAVYPRQVPAGSLLAWIHSPSERDLLQTSLTTVVLSQQQLNSIEQEVKAVNESLHQRAQIMKQQLNAEQGFLAEIQDLSRIGYATKARLLAQQAKVDQIMGRLIEIEEVILKNRQRQIKAELDTAKAQTMLRSSLEHYIDKCMIFNDTDVYLDRVNVPQSSVVRPGQVVISASNQSITSTSSTVVGFLSQRDVAQVTAGMPVLATPLGMDKAQYGGILGQVNHVDSRPSSQSQLASLSGSEAIAQDLFRLLNNPVAVQVKLKRSLQSANNNQAGFVWSSSGWKPFAVRSGDLLNMQVTTRRIRPISLLIPWLRQVSGASAPDLVLPSQSLPGP